MDKSNSLAKARAKSTAFAATVFLLPALLLIVIFMIYPVIDTFVTSTYKWNGISADKIFVGFDNWKTLFKDTNFWNSFIHNVIVMIFRSAFCWQRFWMQADGSSTSLRSYGFYRI